MAESQSVSTPVKVPERVIKSLSALSEISDEQLRQLNEWIKQNSSSLILGDEFPDARAYETLGVSPEAFFAALNLVSSFIYSAPPGKPIILEAYLEALKRQGAAAAVDKAKILLDGIKPDPAVVDFARHRAIAMQSAVPTLNAVTCVCDLRGIFERLPAPSDGPSHVKGVASLMGFEPVALVTIETNDAAGNDNVALVQATESNLKNMLKTLQQALAQMQALKESVSRFKAS